MKKLVSVALLCIVSAWAQCGLTGLLSTPESEGLVSGGKTWISSGEGFTVSWAVSQNADQTWHYQYTFSSGSGEELKMKPSHIIITVSDNLLLEHLFDFSGDIGSVELGMFGQEPSNPNFPLSTDIYGLKINLGGSSTSVSFDSVRSPMWGDFYVKGGGNPKNYAYNTDFGVVTSNLHDITGTPVDAAGNPLFKILVPNTLPEPATLVILAGGVLALRRCRV